MEVDVETQKSSILGFTQDAYQPSVALRGERLAYARNFQNINIWGTSLDPANHELHRLLVSSTRVQRAPDISPDGKRIVFESDRSGAQEIWVSGIDGSNPVQLSHLNDPLTGSPRWSPTGHLIAFDSRAGGQASVYVVDPDGGIPKRLSTSLNGVSIPTWSRDVNAIRLYRRCLQPLPIAKPDSGSMTSGSASGQLSG
jgi:Tol biopolymer transport system component